MGALAFGCAAAPVERAAAAASGDAEEAPAVLVAAEWMAGEMVAEEGSEACVVAAVKGPPHGELGQIQVHSPAEREQ